MMRKTLATIALLACSAPALSATCKISEYWSMRYVSPGVEIPVASEPAVVTQNVTYTTSVQSTAFNAETRFIRVVCDAKAHFVFGPDPAATAADPYLAADTPEYFGVTAGHEVAFYDGTSS